MHTNCNPVHLVERGDFVHIIMLVLIAFSIGAYLLLTTVIISPDGVTFINFAKGLTVDPSKSMLSNNQHPGYPFLIVLMHKFLDVLRPDWGLRGWILSAQCVALLCRLLALIPIYFIAKLLVGARAGFWGVIILIILPDPAKYGSDALSDWPHILFLSSGFLLLLEGARRFKWWLFGITGLITGAGYLIRPECAQLVAYGLGWLITNLVLSRNKSNIDKKILASIVLIVGFIVVAGPFMRLKGYVFPKKQIGGLPLVILSNVCENTSQQDILSNEICRAGFAPEDLARSFYKYINNICETLLYYFVPPLLIGTYCGLRRQPITNVQKFFVIAFVIVNTAGLSWLHFSYGYMDRRHTMPLVLVMISYVPVGLQAIAKFFLEIKGPKRT